MIKINKSDLKISDVNWSIVLSCLTRSDIDNNFKSSRLEILIYNTFINNISNQVHFIRNQIERHGRL